MTMDLFLLALGFFLVVKGGDWFVDSSIAIAADLGVSRMVIGGTLVSLATTMPELVVSATASLMKDSGIAIGNAVGSAVANVGLIVGLVAFLSVVKVDLEDFRRRFLWLFAAMVLLIVFSFSGSLGRGKSAVLLALAAVYLWRDFQKSRSAKTKMPAAEIQKGPLGPAVGRFLIGAGLVIVGSRFLVLSGMNLAGRLGIPSAVVGLSVIAIGTSLPELATAVASVRRGVPDLSIGNIVGANILNLALIIGTSGFLNPLSLDSFTRGYSYPWLIFFTLAFGAILWKHGSAGRKQGVFLILSYLLYMAGLALLPKIIA